MKQENIPQNSEHEQIALLLPWYVTNTLDKTENCLVEAHLKSCLICKIELTNLQRLSTSIRQEELLTPIANTSFLKLKNRIQQSQIPSKSSNGLLKEISARLKLEKINPVNFFVRHQPYAMACIFVLTIFVFSFSFINEKKVLNNFQTLSNTKSSLAGKNEIRLVFANEISNNQILQILKPFNGLIVSGPTLQGVYRVKIGNSAFNKKELTKVISALRENTKIIFAEPSISILPSS